MCISLTLVLLVGGSDFQKQLDIAGENRLEIEQAIREVPENQKAGMAWLLTHMPSEDLTTLTGEFLLANCDLAYEAWQSAPWAKEISEELFFDTILPYASVNERRDDWREDFRHRFAQVVAGARTPSEATVLLNQQMFEMVGVNYSTERPKADQSPYESIEAGKASCTGLSILLIDACRSVGVPARFVGTPLWYNESGNHSWVEIWDDGWHFTGGAEPTGNTLDKAWFADSASKATMGDPSHAIFAVTWNESDTHFPLVWLPEVKTYRAVDVTQRYKQPDVSELVPIRFRSSDENGNRVIAYVTATNKLGELVVEGNTMDDSADANNLLTFMLPKGEVFTIQTNDDSVTVAVDTETIIDFHAGKMTKSRAESEARALWEVKNKQIKQDRATEMKSRIITQGDKMLPFWYTTYGNAPFGKRSLWISMHGGGGAPTEVNTRQWENQKNLYSPQEGVYVAPRAPTDTWNLWHQSHIDMMFERLIENMIVFEGVDPNRVYILGYSAGGDGVYQLAPRMADKLAAAGMMAGHPNETVPDGLRNIGFALHVGGDDTAYDRNKIGEEWKEKLAVLLQEDPEGYAHQVVVHKGKGHWMDGQEAMALPWMAGFARKPYPRKVVWVQDDVVHNRFYWLGVDEPKERTKIVASIDGQAVTIHNTDVKRFTVYLNDYMLDLDKPVSLKYDGEIVSTSILRRSSAIISSTIRDPSDYYSAELSFTLPN